LPYGLLDTDTDRTLELGVRRWVKEQAAMELGYVEQLYTFGNLRRDATERLISIAYLALVRPPHEPGAAWLDCYQLFPWEDWRPGRPTVLDENIVPEVERWADGEKDRRERADIALGLGGTPWDTARALERYELLYEVGLVAERHRDRGEGETSGLGGSMALDHRRMVASALGRIRGKLSYRPVVFELLPDTFTLSRLQEVVEALAGVRLHKSNFRRLVEKGGLVEGTGRLEPASRGRPAELFRFRRDVLRERPAPGVGLPGAR
jgi:hypothetical protein